MLETLTNVVPSLWNERCNARLGGSQYIKEHVTFNFKGWRPMKVHSSFTWNPWRH